MKMKVILIISLLLLFTGCTGTTVYKDGVYRAEADGFHNSWKETVEVTIKDGKIYNISWDAISNNPDIPINKKQYSKSGLYGMLNAGAVDEWCDQAKRAEDYILAYGVDAVKVDQDGYTDAISGCTITVDWLAKLAKECLQQAGQ